MTANGHCESLLFTACWEKWSQKRSGRQNPGTSRDDKKCRTVPYSIKRSPPKPFDSIVTSARFSVTAFSGSLRNGQAAREIHGNRRELILMRGRSSAG